jgi:hypothetical protein
VAAGWIAGSGPAKTTPIPAMASIVKVKTAVIRKTFPSRIFFTRIMVME